MTAGKPACRALLAGDVYPAAARRRELLAACGFESEPELVLFTLDAAIDAGPRRPGQTCLAFDAEHLDSLRLGRRTIAVTASNHLTDFGDGGTAATLAALDNAGFAHLGAGPDLRTARRPLRVELPAGRLTVLAWAETAPRVRAVAATDESAGIADFDADRAVEEVRLAKHDSDWVWAVLHWGEEFVRYPDPEQRRDARRLAEAGADLVVAAHTHVPLGFERLAGSSIYYGLGNFLFPAFREARGYRYRFHPMARRGLALDGELRASGWRWRVRGLQHGRNGRPAPAKARCPDYGVKLADDPAAYRRQFATLRRRERRLHFVQRLLAMSLEERLFRLGLRRPVTEG